jgi:hypothetical protein
MQELVRKMTQYLSFDLTDYLKKIMVLGITYQHSTRRIYISFTDQRPTIIFDVWGEDIKKTVEAFRKEVKGQMNQRNQEEITRCLADNWYKIIDLMNTIKGGNGDADLDQSQSTSTQAPISSTASPIVPLTKAELVIAVAKDNIGKLFIDEYNEPHAAIKVSGYLEVLPLKSSRFKYWLSKIVYVNEQEVIDNNVFSNALSILNAEAIFDSGDPVKLNLRVAQPEGYCWYYDLTNKNWEFAKIKSSGWDVSKGEIIFRRYSNQQAQAYPDRNYEPDIFDRFMKLLNIKTDDRGSILLLKCYIIFLFIPEVQKVVLMLHGSQGTAKSSLQELIKTLVDPSIMKTLTFPRDVNEFLQQLSHNFVVFYDNVSITKPWISDLLCRAVTGSASSKRQLYTDDDDVIRSFKRCVGFNGINLGATKADLLDRGLIIKLEEIEPKNRLKPSEIWKQFEELRPQLLGYIFDILVKVTHWKNNGFVLNLDGLLRMSEFAEYGEMILRAIGYNENEFINAYYKNIELQSEEVIESSDVARCLIYMMFEKYGEKNDDNRSEWVGMPTQLYNEIKKVAEDLDELNIDIKEKYFPKSAKGLSRKLHEIIPNLKSVGLQVKEHRDGKKRIIVIRKLSS